MADVTLLTGAVWGIIGAFGMMVAMKVIGSESPPPFAAFWAKLFGGKPQDAMPQAMSVHLLYAAIMGALYTAIFSTFNAGLAITTLAGGVVWGLVWGIALLIGGKVFWIKLILGLEPDEKQRKSFMVAHLTYGLVLGILTALLPHLL